VHDIDSSCGLSPSLCRVISFCGHGWHGPKHCKNIYAFFLSWPSKIIPLLVVDPCGNVMTSHRAYLFLERYFLLKRLVVYDTICCLSTTTTRSVSNRSIYIHIHAINTSIKTQHYGAVYFDFVRRAPFEGMCSCSCSVPSTFLGRVFFGFRKMSRTL
jgi:hypothetical protein